MEMTRGAQCVQKAMLDELKILKNKIPIYVVGVRLSLMTSSKGFRLFYVLPGNGIILCPSTVH